MSFTVGDRAAPFGIRHAPGSDVRFALLLTDEAGAAKSLPAGAVLELVVDGLSAPLPGLVTAGRVDWDIQSQAFDGVPAVAAAALWYRQGTWDGRWFAGYYQSTTGSTSSVSVPGTVVVSTDGVQLLTVALSVGVPPDISGLDDGTF